MSWSILDRGKNFPGGTGFVLTTVRLQIKVTSSAILRKLEKFWGLFSFSERCFCVCFGWFLWGPSSERCELHVKGP